MVLHAQNASPGKWSHTIKDKHRKESLFGTGNPENLADLAADASVRDFFKWGVTRPLPPNTDTKREILMAQAKESLTKKDDPCIRI